MKTKSFLFLLLAMLPFFALTGNAKDIVTLKNGSIIKGEVLETIPGQSVKIKTSDGSLFVYQLDEVASITKDEKATASDDNFIEHRGLDYDINAGYNINTKGSGGAVHANLTVGKRFSKNFYLGAGAGINIATSGDNDISIPIFTNFKYFFPLSSSKITPLASVGVGYAINTAGDKTFGSGKERVTVKATDAVYFEVMPGIQYPISKNVDFNFYAGYIHSFNTKGGGNAGAVALRLGITLHKSAADGEPAYIPTLDNGMQVTLEGDFLNPWNIGSNAKALGTLGGGILLGYKINPNISFGIGYGMDYTYLGTNEESYYSNVLIIADGVSHRAFVRGQYRLNDKKFSPIAALDFGMRFLNDSNDEDRKEVADRYNFKKSCFFVTPQVGFSLRTTNNSYFETRVGYSIGPKAGSYDVYHAKTSGFYISFGWTHTMTWLSR